MRYDEIRVLMDKLESRGKGNTSDALMYFVAPFLKSLGYDTFDMDVVDIRQDEGVANVQVSDDINMIVSLERGVYDGDEVDKIFLKVNMGKRNMILYFKVLGKWEEIVTVNLNEGEDAEYVEVAKKIAREQILREFAQKGERFLSEIVIDYQLERGDWASDFMTRSLMKELEEPSDEFIILMAQRLRDEYTTREVDWIKERLTGMGEQGVLTLVKNALNGIKVNVTETKEEVTSDFSSIYREKREEEVNKQEESKEEDNKVPNFYQPTRNEPMEDVTKTVTGEVEEVNKESRGTEEDVQGKEEVVSNQGEEDKGSEDVHHLVSISNEDNEDDSEEEEVLVPDIIDMFSTGNDSKDEDIFEGELSISGDENKSNETRTFGSYNVRNDR